MKVTPLLATPPTVTTTFPEVAPAGTFTTMPVALQLVGIAAVPLKVTVLAPRVDPKLVPVIVTAAPTGTEVGFRLVMFGVTFSPRRAGIVALRCRPSRTNAAEIDNRSARRDPPVRRRNKNPLLEPILPDTSSSRTQQIAKGKNKFFV